MATTQEVDLLRRQLEELNVRMEDIRQQSANAAECGSNGTHRGCENGGRQSVTRPRPEDMRVGKPEPYVPGKDFDDWDFTFNGYACTLDPTYPALLKAARQATTVVTATTPHEQQHDAHTERSTESGEKSREQRIRGLQTVVHDVRNF